MPDLSSELDQRGNRVEFTFEVAFEGLHGEAAEIGGAVARPVLRCQRGDGRTQDVGGSDERVR